jgi:hypothetical protein
MKIFTRVKILGETWQKHMIIAEFDVREEKELR